MIEPVFPLAPKITYVSFETGEVIVTTSGVAKKVSNAFRTMRRFRPSLRECVAEHRKAAHRFGLGRLVLQNVPMLFEKPALEPDNVGCDPGGGPAYPPEAAMRDDVPLQHRSPQAGLPLTTSFEILVFGT